MNAYLVCIDGGCSDSGHSDNERNQALVAGRGQTGSRWRDERWALDPTCDICHRQRGRYEVGLFTPKVSSLPHSPQPSTKGH